MESLLRFPCDVEISGLGAHRCICGFEYLPGRFLRTYRTVTSESNQPHQVVAWSASFRLRNVMLAEQHPNARLHLRPERSNLTP